jgi:hypothetical protein
LFELYINYLNIKNDNSTLVPGLFNFIELISKEKEDKYFKNNIPYYSSDIRHLVNKLLLKLINDTGILSTEKNELENLLNKLVLNVFMLKFEECKHILHDIFKLKNVSLFCYLYLDSY